MTKKQKRELLKAAELIAKEKSDYICVALWDVNSKLDIYKDKTCRMFNPNSTTWWGLITMKVPSYSKEARNARLLGIAFMLTMPKDMIDKKINKKCWIKKK